MMAYDLFISYRRTGGKELARALKSELELRNYAVFLDFDELKDGVFDRRIMEAIDSAPLFLVLLSPHALDRCADENDWVRREIEYAIRKKRRLIPVDPDRSFDGFPADLPDALRTALGQHQFSEIMFGQLFKSSVEKLVRERIAPVLEGCGSNAAREQQSGALFHVETDTECRILKFGREIAVARPGEDTVIRLRRGRHKLEFVSVGHADDRLSVIHPVEDNDMEDILAVELLPVREKRLQAEAAQAAAATEADCKAEIESLNERAQAAFDAGNEAEAVSLLQKAADMGDCGAQYNLGCRYAVGFGVSQDDAMAVEWYCKAAEQGDVEAQFRLGDCFDSGTGVSKDEEQAVAWYRKAAEQGNSSAQYRLGVCYYEGHGVAQDYVKAVEWYRKAAAQGVSHAQYYLGKCYYDGHGVSQSYDNAVAWYRKAAKLGNRRAQYHLGKCYYDGCGVSQDYGKALEWYYEAAKGIGNISRIAEYDLGWCYEHGYGVPKNRNEAEKWYRRAANHGCTGAKKALNNL